MQPPTYTRAPLRAQLEQLRRTAQHNIHTRPSGHSERLCVQIKTWAQSMPPELRSRRFTIEEIELLAGILGKHGKHAAHHHIAQAIRAVGFTPVRDWTVAGRNRRYWKFSGEMK